MATTSRSKKTTPARKKPAGKKRPQKPVTVVAKTKLPARLRQKVTGFLARRPHRSFRRTLRRDYKRSLKLPGYWALSISVFSILWQRRKLFGLMALTYIVLNVLLVGMTSQDTYTQLSDTLQQTSGDIFGGGWGAIGQAGLLLGTIMSGGSSASTESQQIYAGLLALLMWLTTVWLLRSSLAGHAVKLRDGLYSAGAPLISTFLVALLGLLQLVPLAIALIAFGAAEATGFLNSGAVAMLFWIAESLLVLLSLYLITSTFMALVVVTLPGMYPGTAIRTAGDLVVGRRLRILLRLAWMALGIAVVWAVVMIPLVLLDGWIKSLIPAIQWLPVIPVALLVMATATVIWVSAYVYVLYRKVVEDDAEPA